MYKLAGTLEKEEVCKQLLFSLDFKKRIIALNWLQAGLWAAHGDLCQKYLDIFVLD